MSSSRGTPSNFTQWPNCEPHGSQVKESNNTNENGVSTRPMRLKVLYTFDDQNKTNCLARGQDVLQVKTIAMDETTSIGIIELKTCIEAVVQCSPEIVTRLGQADYTVYAYDYSEYDNPLVGQGMLSRALAASSPNPDVPAQQSQKLITGRVCKNILGIFNNGVKETLEVKLRLVPVPTVVQGEFLSTMEKYREMSKSLPPGFDPNEWASLMGHRAGGTGLAASSQRSSSMNMEVVNQLLNPNLLQHQQHVPMETFNQSTNAENSGNETRGAASNNGKAKKTSRPSSRASVKRPRAKGRQSKSAAVGGNTSGYEEGTDGDDGPAPKKRAKITKADWNSKSSFGPPTDSLRVAASTAGSLRMFRPIAMSPAPNAISHVQELPRAPTPVPNLPNQHLPHDGGPAQSRLRRDSFACQIESPRQHISPYPRLEPAVRPEDQVRYSIESAGPSPERNVSPAETPQDIGSSPPLMRTCSPMRSSPPCPSSPVLPQMPRTDSGFMSGSMEELFGEEDEIIRPIEDEDLEVIAEYNRGPSPQLLPPDNAQPGFMIEEETPGPMELLPTRMPPFAQKSKVVPKPQKSRAGSVMSEDGQQSLPPLKNGSHPPSRRRTPSHPDLDLQRIEPQNASQSSVLPSQPTGAPAGPLAQPVLPQAPPAQPQSRPESRMMVRTASVGSLTLPTVAASDPVLPPSSLQRSQTWSEAPHPFSEAPFPMQIDTTMHGPLNMPMAMATPMPQQNDLNAVPYCRTLNAKKAAIRHKLETAIANGEMPPFCSNCGAIETPTWRKAWSQEHQGAPGYYEYSDEPGRVTAIVILARDNESNPTSYQLIKKFLGPEEDQNDWNEFLLCNPCGIWMSKYKSQRPEDKWENSRNRTDKNGQERKRPTQRPSRSKKSNGPLYPTSEANFPQSEAYFPPSEAYHPQFELLGQGMSPPEVADAIHQQNDLQIQHVELPNDRERSTSLRPIKRLHAMTSDAASAALRRAIQSSPARWAGTRQSPIEVEDELGSTRRLLFPSPRKDGSPKVLGEVATNVVQIAAECRSPKEQTAEITNKENCPPTFDAKETDAELLMLFEEELLRPSTPVQRSPAPNPFKTPTRLTPSHRPITRSVSRSIRSAKSLGQTAVYSQYSPSRTPGSLARRRSPRNHPSVFESPFTATLNQLMSEANNHTSPSRNDNFELNFSNLPDLPVLEHPDHHGSQKEINFSLEDFFSTDVPMPSSPPKLFHLYEDPVTMANVDWDEFNEFDASLLENESKRNKEGEAVEVKIEASSEEVLENRSQKTEAEKGEGVPRSE